MATLSQDQRWLSQTFSATGTSTNSLGIRSVTGMTRRYGTLWIVGTFTGSISIEGSPPGAGTYAAVSGATFTTPISIGLSFSAEEDIRFNVTALSAGTVTVTLHYE